MSKVKVVLHKTRIKPPYNISIMSARRTAFRLRPLIESLPSNSKVHSLAYCSLDRSVFVGTADGSVHQYRVDLAARGVKSAQLVVSKSLSRFRRHAVEQLLVVGKLGVLIALCGGGVTVHTLRSRKNTLDTVDSCAEMSKACYGATLLSLDQRGGPT